MPLVLPVKLKMTPIIFGCTYVPILFNHTGFLFVFRIVFHIQRNGTEMGTTGW